VGGHKYAGNVIIFSSDPKGEVTGHWYGYVTPDDVPVLLQKHIEQGEIVDHLWRGQLGLSEEQQKKALALRNMTNGGLGTKESLEATGTYGASCNPAPAGGCCQGNGGGFTCCQSDLPKERQDKSIPAEQSEKSNESNEGSKKGHTKICSMPTWFETWDRADTCAALAVVAAAASVFVAFRVYKNIS
jgi:(2Fe-2S) ferredoxin